MEQRRKPREGGLRRNSSDEFLRRPVPEWTPKDKLVYYPLVSLQVALWVAIAWVLSHLHIGGPCFVVVLLIWVYAHPLKTLLSRIRAKVCPLRRSQDNGAWNKDGA